MRLVEFSVCVFLALVTCRANDYKRTQTKINTIPEVKNAYIDGLAKLLGRIAFSEKVDIRGSFIESVMQSTSDPPYGAEITPADIIRMLVSTFKEVPLPRDDTHGKNFWAKGDLNGIVALTRAIKKWLVTEQPIEKDKSSVVQTEQGRVRGVLMDEFGVKFFAYFGIPYAEMPKRFQAPKPPKPWKGIRRADRELTYCPQKLVAFGQIAGTEDCLHLSVMTPQHIKPRTPVIVWIHGGAFRVGSSFTFLTHPGKFLNEGVIFVAVHYRMGALGFLSTGTKEAPGNAGMKDVVAALKWIKANIANFGGDPDNITLFGISTGGTMVEYLTVSPTAKNLFNKGIIGSGSMFNVWSHCRDPLKYAYQLGRNMGFNGTYVKSLVRFLRRADPLHIVEAQEKIFEDNNPSGEFLPFVPCTEEDIPEAHPFLTQHPEVIMRSGNYNKVPMIYSFTDQEGLEFFRLKSRLDNLNNIAKMLEYYLPPDLLDGLYDPLDRREILNKIKQFYFRGQRLDKSNVQGVVSFLGDSNFLLGVLKSVRLKVETSSEPTFLAEFAYNGELNRFKFGIDLDVTGVAHADELGYVFSLPLQDVYAESNATSDLVSKRLVNMYANFARYGHPTPNITKLVPAMWHPIESTKTYDYLQITDGLIMKQNPYKERRDFWNYIYKYKKYLLEIRNQNYYKRK